MPPAARLGDMHTCPMQTPAVVPVPHVGGPIMPVCAPTVLIEGSPAARMHDLCMCAVGPPDPIVTASMTVVICGANAARVGDTTTHGGVIVKGAMTVMIGDKAPPGTAGFGSGAGAAQAKALKQAAKDGKPFCEECYKQALARRRAK